MRFQWDKQAGEGAGGGGGAAGDSLRGFHALVSFSREDAARAAAGQDSNPGLAGRRAGRVPPSRAGGADAGVSGARGRGRWAAARALLSPFMSARGRELPARGRGPRTMRRFLPPGPAGPAPAPAPRPGPPGNGPGRPPAPVHRVAPRETAGAGRGLRADPGPRAEAEVTQRGPGGSWCTSVTYTCTESPCKCGCTRAQPAALAVTLPRGSATWLSCAPESQRPPASAPAAASQARRHPLVDSADCAWASLRCRVLCWGIPP